MNTSDRSRMNATRRTSGKRTSATTSKAEAKFLVSDVAREALFFESSRIGRADQNRIMAALDRLGWKRLKKDWKKHISWGKKHATLSPKKLSVGGAAGIFKGLAANHGRPRTICCKDPHVRARTRMCAHEGLIQVVRVVRG